MIIDAIILARGGSKGIPKKNIMDFCGKPLISWTIEQCLASKYTRDVWVSSDSQEILNVAKQFGASTLLRPEEISGDLSTSESGWLHAVDYIINEYSAPDAVLAPQVTSPLRESCDIDGAIETFMHKKLDSLFSASKLDDFLVWAYDKNDNLISINHDYTDRKRRQDSLGQFLENGSFYIFKPNILIENQNRLGGKFGMFVMDKWKSYEIDNYEDIGICEYFMNKYLL